VPSRTEPFGNVAVEALLACRPVVASRVQGLEEVIIDNRTGLLVKPNDAESLACGIATVLSDHSLALRLAEEGRNDALERFSLTRYHDRITAALNRLE
jgi:glycosyltransferase involved in cell wall biosynthesis